MMLKKKPKVLVISNLCFSETSNNGRTLGNFFRNWPHDKIAQFYINPDKQWMDICDKYYCYTDQQVVEQACFKRNKKNRQVPNENDNKKVGKNALTMIVRTFLWKITPWESKGFNKFVNDFAPELIILQAGDTIFMYDLARTISRKHKIPLVIYNSEDHVLRKENYFGDNGIGGAFYPFFHMWLKHSFWKTMRIAKECIYISDKLKESYNKIMKHNSITIYTSSEIKKSKRTEVNDPIKIAYFGNLEFDRETSLIKLANRFHDEDNRICVDVYGTFSDKIKESLSASNAIQMKGFIPYQRLKEVIYDTDVVIHVESFSTYYSKFNDNYFSTKIADCISCGKPFVVYAPEKIAFVEYLSKNDAAIIITSDDNLNWTVKKVLSDAAFRNSKTANAIALANKNHNVEQNMKMFQDILCCIYRR